MTRTFLVIPMLAGGAGLLATSCGDNAGPTVLAHDGGGAEASASGTDAGASGDDGADDAPTAAPQTYLRIAQLSPDLPSIDVCVAPHGTTAFQGPLVAQLAASEGDDGGANAAPPGLAYAQVSAYLSLDAGPYDLRLVAAGATGCSPSLATPSPGSSGTPDWTDLPSLASGTYATLLVAGDWEPAGGDPGLTLSVLPDDAVLAGAAAALRGVNAVPSWPAADFGLGSFGTDWTPVLTGVSFAAASAHASVDDGTVDANGYLPISPLASTAMGAQPSSAGAGVAVATASSVAIGLGSIATILAVGGKTGDSAHPPALLLCNDNQPSGGLLSDCAIAQ